MRAIIQFPLAVWFTETPLLGNLAVRTEKQLTRVRSVMKPREITAENYIMQKYRKGWLL